MLQKRDYPILEFDCDSEAIIHPEYLQKKYGVLPYDTLVITFFKEVIDQLLDENKIEHCLTVHGENDLDVYVFKDANVYLLHGCVGCPACCGFLEDLIGLGIKKVMFCGGGGVLDSNMQVGELLVVEGSIRDEGFSYHYVEPSRIIYSEKETRDKICGYLNEKNLPYIEGLTWTTDAIYRETRDKIIARKAEGAKIVEMEQSGCIAVAQFRKIKYGAIIYAGDDVSQNVWADRGWHTRKSIRYNLVEICKDLVQKI